MIKAPYPVRWRVLYTQNGTHNQRKTLQVVSETRDSFDQIGNDLSKDPSDNFQIIGSSLPLDEGGFRLGRPSREGSLGREDRARYSSIGGRDGADDGLESRLSLEGRDVGVSQGCNWIGLGVSQAKYCMREWE
jgi:hypothetical protein